MKSSVEKSYPSVSPSRHAADDDRVVDTTRIAETGRGPGPITPAAAKTARADAAPGDVAAAAPSTVASAAAAEAVRVQAAEGVLRRAAITSRAAAAIILEQARILHANAQGTAIATAVNGLLLVVAYIGSPLPPGVVLGWYVLLVLALLYRFRVMARFDHVHTGEGARRWLGAFTTASAVMGSVWGVAALAMVFAPDPLRTALVVFVLAVMTASASASSGVYWRSAIAFNVPALLPLFAYLVHRGFQPGASHVVWAMAALTAVYFLLLARVARNTEGSIIESATLKEQKSTLAERLTESVQELEISHRALAEKRDELQIVADYSYAWESWFADDGTLLWLNPAVERLTGYTVEECRAMENFPKAIIYAADRDAVSRFLKDAPGAPGMTGLEFRITRKDGSIHWCAAESVQARDAGGALHGFRMSVRDVTERRTLQNELERLASIDPLTGALNRRKFYEVFEREAYRAGRYDRPTMLASFDIDHFKLINDAYGHAAGDDCLKAFVDLIRSSTRQSDIIARFGGEEFVLLMPETESQAAIELCERLKHAVAGLQVDTERGPVTFTVSVGVTEVDPQIPNLDFSLGIADAALFQSKRNGRNRVTYMMADAAPRALKN